MSYNDTFILAEFELKIISKIVTNTMLVTHVSHKEAIQTAELNLGLFQSCD